MYRYSFVSTRMYLGGIDMGVKTPPSVVDISHFLFIHRHEHIILNVYEEQDL